MKPSDDLFELIKSLTHSEKRYFKLISSKSVADNLYVKLFDAMDAQIVYDEVHIKEQFKGQKFVKQIHVLKNYLYNILLKSLAAYHNEKSEVSHVLEMLQFIEVLFEKGFYGQCKKMVKRAQKICLDGELLMIEYNINEWELKLLLRENCFSEIKEKNKRQKYILDRLNENNLYKDQSTIVYQKILESANAITNNEVDYIEQIIKNPLFDKDDSLLTREAKYYKYSSLGFYAQAIKDYKLITKYARKTLHIVEDMPGSPYRYITIMKNLCGSLLKLKDFKEVSSCIVELRHFANKLDQSKWKGAYHSAVIMAYQIELALYFNSSSFHLIPTLVNDIEDNMRSFSKTIQMTELTDMKYNIAHGLFINKDYQRSLKWISDILNQPRSKFREDFFASSQVIFFLIHFEIGNKIILLNLLKNAINQLEKRTTKFNIVKVFLESLYNLAKEDDPVKQKNTLISIRNKVEKSNQPEDKTFEYFDILSWLESKIQKREMAEILMENKRK